VIAAVARVVRMEPSASDPAPGSVRPEGADELAEHRPGRYLRRSGSSALR